MIKNEDSKPLNSNTNKNEPLLYSRHNIQKKKKNDELTTDVLVPVQDHFNRPQVQEDRYDLVGKTIAMKLRGLGDRQSLIVEKKINDILFEAEMDTLNS